MHFEIPRAGNKNKFRTITGVSLVSPDKIVRCLVVASHMDTYPCQTSLKNCTDVVNVVVQLGADLLHQSVFHCFNSSSLAALANMSDVSI